MTHTPDALDALDAVRPALLDLAAAADLAATLADQPPRPATAEGIAQIIDRAAATIAAALDALGGATAQAGRERADALTTDALDRCNAARDYARATARAMRDAAADLDGLAADLDGLALAHVRDALAGLDHDGTGAASATPTPPTPSPRATVRDATTAEQRERVERLQADADQRPAALVTDAHALAARVERAADYLAAIDAAPWQTCAATIERATGGRA